MDRHKQPDRQPDSLDNNLHTGPYGSYQDKREDVIDSRIREAQERGEFDNLPGLGKPLPRDAGYEMAGEHWMSNHILKQAGYLPIWLELRKEIAVERGAVEAALAAYREQAGNPGGSSPKTLRQLEDCYVQLATAINTKIDQHNDRCPNTQLLNRFPEDAIRRWK